MTTGKQTPEPKSTVEGIVADAVDGNWVDTYAPAITRPFLRLSRADRPIGTWLLLIPCLWSLFLAMTQNGHAGWYDLWIAFVCGAGAWLMRGAGCCWNDITDRKIDAQVARTASRPLPSGQIGVKAAVIWMVAQALLAFILLMTLPWLAIILGIAALGPVAIYPFAKRFTWWPQAFLGVAINWGVWVAWAAHSGSLSWAAVPLYASGIAWTLFYDTIYAHQDREDDALIGVKSTARLFGDNTPRWLTFFMCVSVILMGLSVILAVPNGALLQFVVLLAGPWAFGWHMLWQLRRFDPENPGQLLHLMRSNRDAGLIPVLVFATALLLGLR